MPLDNTNWSQTETETKPDVFSLEGLIAWLETQPPETKYDWGCAGECLFALWGMAVTDFCETDAYMAATDGLSDALGLSRRVEPTTIAYDEPHTFGAALSRARALLASRNSDAYLADTRK